MDRVFKPGALQLTGNDLTSALRGIFVCASRHRRGITTRFILFENSYYEVNSFEWDCLKKGATPEDLGMQPQQYDEE